MPFTFSHPAIVLPLKYLPERFYSFTGLIIGSIIPDFEYFIRMKVESLYSHNWFGLFYFDLPLGILISFVYHNIARNSLIDNLPYTLKERFITSKKVEWNKYFKNNWLVVIISILIGSASHILWDSFTHPHGQFVEFIPLLKRNIVIFNLEIPIYKILQHISTMLGGIIVVYTIWRMPKSKINDTITKWKYWMVVSLISLIIILIHLLLTIKSIGYPNILVTGISGMLIAFCMTPFFISGRD